MTMQGKIATFTGFSIALMILGGRVFACNVAPNVSINAKFSVDYRVEVTEPFTAEIFPNQNEISSVSVLVNGKVLKTFPVNKLVNRGGGNLYRLESSIGPEHSKADIIVPLNRNYVTVVATVDDDCKGKQTVPVIGADSGIYAVVVGVNEYSFISNNLNYAVQDASQFLSTLEATVAKTDRRFNYELLTNEKATKAAIERALEEAAAKMSSEGTLIVYFSGHGLVKARRSKVQAFLVPYDGERRLAKSTMLSHKNMLEILQDAPARNKVFIFDSCFSGRGAFEEFEVLPNLHEKYLPIDRQTELAMTHNTSWMKIPENVLWFSSSSSGKVSYELDKYEHGLFTHFLLKSVEDADFTAGRRKLRYSDIKDYIRDKIEDEFGPIQKPSTNGDDDILAVGLWSPAP